MRLLAHTVPLPDLLPWRDAYRREMNCQVVHDSLHQRTGWVQSYQLACDDTVIGYGSVLLGGPWIGTRTLFEFYVQPECRTNLVDAFETLHRASGADRILAQTNDAFLIPLLHLCATDVVSEKLVFNDQLTTTLPAPDAVFRPATPADAVRMFPHHREPVGSHVLECGGALAATGGIAFHYNRPYGDIFLEVAAPFRRRGLGSYLVQELKRVCREQGSVPCARCDTDDIASRRTAQKAGLVPCAHLLTGRLRPPAPPVA